MKTSRAFCAQLGRVDKSSPRVDISEEQQRRSGRDAVTAWIRRMMGRVGAEVGRSGEPIPDMILELKMNNKEQAGQRWKMSVPCREKGCCRGMLNVADGRRWKIEEKVEGRCLMGWWHYPLKAQ